MKNLFLFVVPCIIFCAIGCAPNAQQLRKTLEDDPSIFFNIIEKHPDQFMQVVNKAARESQEKLKHAEIEQEEKSREEEFKKPLVPDIQEQRVFFGKASAPVTIVEYSDFECPYCSKGFQTVKQILTEYPNEVRVLFKHLPLDFHPKAMPAAKMFEAIALQDKGKAQKFHDLIFQNQEEFKKKGDAYMKQAAKSLGVDIKKMESDLSQPTIAARIEADIEEAKKFGISGTPGFIINGVSLRGAYPFPEFKKIIDRHLQKK